MNGTKSVRGAEWGAAIVAPLPAPGQGVRGHGRGAPPRKDERETSRNRKRVTEEDEPSRRERAQRKKKQWERRYVNALALNITDILFFSLRPGEGVRGRGARARPRICERASYGHFSGGGARASEASERSEAERPKTGGPVLASSPGTGEFAKRVPEV